MFWKNINNKYESACYGPYYIMRKLMIQSAYAHDFAEESCSALPNAKSAHKNAKAFLIQRASS